MRRTRIALIATPALAAGLLLSACASDRAVADAAPEGATALAAAPATTSAPSGRTREQFVADTVPLCDALIAAREVKAKEYFPSETEPPTVEQIQAFYEDFAPNFADFALGFAKLEPAPADRAAYEEVREGAWFVLAQLTKAGQDQALSQHLLDTDEAELHNGDGDIAALGVNPEC